MLLVGESGQGLFIPMGHGQSSGLSLKPGKLGVEPANMQVSIDGGELSVRQRRCGGRFGFIWGLAHGRGLVCEG